MGQYKTVRLLSKKNDGIGGVFLMEHKDTQEQCVLKKIAYLDNPVHRAIFDKEVQALTKLTACPNIVRLLDYEYGRSKESGQIEGHIYIEYVEGDTLKNVNYKYHKPSDKFSIIKQSVAALRSAHEEGIIHRDINPQNIMITDEVEVKLIDFGICKIKGAIQSGTTYQYATNRYAAPEVGYHSENATEQSDIYSLGAVIYFIFTNQEPPLPEEFITTIESASGLDIALKDIIKKMVAYSPHERYESLVDVEFDLSSLLSKYVHTDEQYVFTVPIERLSDLRRKRLAPSKRTNPELLQDDLRRNFLESRAYLDENNGVNYFIFDGINYSMKCTFNNEIFSVVSFSKLDIVYRERNKKFAMPLTGKCVFFDAQKRAYPNHHSFELHNRLIDHADKIRSQKNINNEYFNVYGFWKDFIQAMINDTAQQALKFNYSSYKYSEGIYRFQLCDDSCLGDDSITTETIFIYEKNTRTGIKQTEIGSFIGFEDDGSTIIIKATRPPKMKRALAQSGSFCVDYRREIAQYKRQERALDEFMQDEVYDKKLKGIITGIEKAGFFEHNQPLTFFDKKLDHAQQSAVQKIINSKDLALIQGPPGTGKTNVLIEVVKQILHHNKRNPLLTKKILIVSQSHAAVDKILEDLHYQQASSTIIRIGAEDKLSALAKKEYGLETQKKSWIDTIIQKCQKDMCVSLESEDIDYDSFVAYAQAKDIMRIKAIEKEDLDAAQKAVFDFQQKYAVDDEHPVIAKLLNQYHWLIQLPESLDIDEYFIRNATIVAGTCSGFISNPFIRDIIFDYVIIDEAAKATLPEMMVSLIKAKKAVLVGDHKQLPPVFDRMALDRADLPLKIEELQNGGFGKIFDLISDECKQTLTVQYRMHPCIGSMISQIFYDGQVQNGIYANERTLNLTKLSFKPMTWISTSSIDRKQRFEQKVRIANGGNSYRNPLEVDIICGYLKQLDQETAIKDYSIGIITPYRAQLNLIQKRIKSLSLENVQVEVNTVDAFQGSQKDIILYSTVRSSDKAIIGFLKEEARLNVSFSRAKSVLIIVGDMDFLNNEKIRDNRFPFIIKYMQENRADCDIIMYNERG